MGERLTLKLAPIPSSLLDAISSVRGSHTATGPIAAHTDFAAVIRDGAAEGERNVTTAQLAGFLFRYLPDSFAASELVLAWNEARNNPPLDESEVLRTIESIATRELQRRRKGA